MYLVILFKKKKMSNIHDILRKILSKMLLLIVINMLESVTTYHLEFVVKVWKYGGHSTSQFVMMSR